MIKRLRRRFIIIYMAILSCFLITILAGIYCIVYNSELDQSEEIMQMALQNNAKLDDGDKPNNSPPKKIIDFEENDVIITSAGGTYTQDDSIYPMRSVDNTDLVALNADNNTFEDVFKSDNDKYMQQDNNGDSHFNDEDYYVSEPIPNDDDLLVSESDSHLDNWKNSESRSKNDIPTNNETMTESTIDFDHIPESTMKSKKDEPDPSENKDNDINPIDRKGEEYVNDDGNIDLNDTMSPNLSDSSTDVTSESVSISNDTKSTVTSPTDKEPPDIPDDKFSETTQYEGELARNTIYVKVNSNYEIKRISYQYFESGNNLSIEQSVYEVIESGVTSGKTEIDNVKFRYYILNLEDESGYDIVFLDRAIEIATLKQLLIILVAIGGVGLIVLFGLSFLLSSWATTPIANAWDKQKQFIADASHELKTPLTVIATNTDVILSNADDTVRNQAKWLNYIKSETARMSKLVADLLYIAKTNVNEVSIIMNEFNLSHTILGVCLVFESVAFEKGKLLDTDIDENISFKGDEDRIKQLITILIDNAIVHSDGNANIMVTLKHDSKDKIRLSVSNTHGEDIPEGMENRLFERFFRVDKARNRSNGSHGLGLNIAQSIVKNHDGTITVNSTKDHVVTFTIILDSLNKKS